MEDYTFQTIRDWEGKIRKITQKEYTASVGHGQFYPPEGALSFQDEGDRSTAYFVGGARYKKPEHWAMSDTMFRVTLKQIDDDKNYTIGAFDIIKPSTSATSYPPKLAFASGLTIKAGKKNLLAIIVNGKCLDVRSPEHALSNEIHVIEIVQPLNSTYRTRTYRTPDRANKFPIHSTKKEILQAGDIPRPKYGSTLTPLTSNGTSGTAVLVGGNSVEDMKPTAVEIMMGTKSLWKENSCGDLHLLKYNLSSKSFIWTKLEIQIDPRAHHSVMLSGRHLFIFGGVNYDTNLRYKLQPVVIDVTTWTSVMMIVPDSFPDIALSGHSFLQVSKHKCLLFGGYNTVLAKPEDTPTDTLIQLVVHQLLPTIHGIKMMSLGSSPVAQSSMIMTPEEDVFIVGGGTQERWALISKYVAPATPCDLDKNKKCILVNTPECYGKDTVNWLGCDGLCRRFFHVPCLKMSYTQFLEARKRRKWFCNRSDCKK